MNKHVITLKKTSTSSCHGCLFDKGGRCDATGEYLICDSSHIWAIEDLKNLYKLDAIETAPKDGTRLILAYNDRWGRNEVVFGFYDSEYNAWFSVSHNEIEPSHWMSIPEIENDK